MKLGHFGALCLAGITAVFAALVYWDMQSGSFLVAVFIIPFLTGAEALAMAVFPGGPLTYRQAARDTSPDGLTIWWQQVPALHRRAWLLAPMLGIYMGLGMSEYLQGHGFFSLPGQAELLVVLLVFGLLVRKQLRQLWG